MAAVKKLLVILALAAVLAGACFPQSEAGVEPIVPVSGDFTDEASNIPVPPDRDLFEVAGRLRPGAGEIPRVVNPTPPEIPVGARETFWLSDLQSFRHFTATATLRLVTPRAYMYVEDGQNVSQEDLERSAREFEENIFPTVTHYYGDKWYLGIDNDPRLTIVNARIPAVAGYFSASDQYPIQVNPYSNQRKAIYMNLGAVRPGSNAYNAVLAHEFQHALHWGINPNSESWINEGAAELAAEISGFPSGFTNAFLSRPDTQLTAWPEETGTSGPHYGAAMLFIKYLAQQYGGYEALEDILSAPGRGPRGITNFLAAKGYKADFDTVFKDWVVANYLDQPGGGRYSYPQDNISARGESISRLGEHEGTVNQHAADYLELAPGSDSIAIDFQGAPVVRLVPDQPHSGRALWWSNRADSMNTTLTREFDLTGLQTATLRFWTWYDIEKPWDYAYVEASTDGGKTWTILPGKHTTTENPLGNSFGPGFTGTSGGGKVPEWVEESVDLTPFAGKKVLVRFEYITDEAVNEHGMALDDISIPELGFVDDAERNAGWEARGFFRTTNTLRNRLSLQIIKIGVDTSVEEVPVDNEGRARLELKGLGSDIEKAVLVVSALTPVTTEAARYRLNITELAP